MSNDVYSTYRPPTQSGGLLKLQDGQTVRLRICSEPVVFQSEYKGNLSTRYAWVVWNVDEGMAQILTQGVTFYRTIANLAQDEDWGDPQTYGIKVKREGTDTDTVYQVTPATAKTPLTDEQRAEADDIDLIASLEKLPSVSQVAWLADVVRQSEEAKGSGVIAGAKLNKVIEGAKELDDLSSIPF